VAGRASREGGARGLRVVEFQLSHVQRKTQNSSSGVANKNGMNMPRGYFGSPMTSLPIAVTRLGNHR